MKNLNKRQIIILAITAIAVLFAAYDFLISQPAVKKAKLEAKPVEIDSFVTGISNDVMKDKVAGLDGYIIKKAEMDWDRSPFWGRAEYREFAGNESGGGLAAKIIYSGYVDAGRKRMAVINGYEYEAGDSLDIEGYILKSVTPSRVLIVNPSTGSELFIPMQE